MRLDSLDTEPFRPVPPAVVISALESPCESRARRRRRNKRNPITASTNITPPATPPPIAPALVDLDVEGTGVSVGELVGSERVRVGVGSIGALVETGVDVADGIGIVVVELRAIS